jgi:hypothetical protein
MAAAHPTIACDAIKLESTVIAKTTICPVLFGLCVGYTFSYEAVDMLAPAGLPPMR